MSEKTQVSNRKVLLINPRFQFQFMAWMGGLAILVVLVMQAAHAWFFYNLRAQAAMAGLPADHVFYRFIQDRQLEMSVITGITFFVVLTLVSVIGIVLSHKIAGPMYRLKKHFDEIAETGKPRPFNFREGDYFQEIPEAYNQQFKEQEATASSIEKQVKKAS